MQDLLELLLELELRLELAEILFGDFAEAGNLYTGPGNDELPHRTCERYDGAMPSAPSLALEVATRLAQLSAAPHWQQRAEELLRGATPEIRRYPQGFVHLLAAAERVLGRGRELVILGPRQAPATLALLASARRAGPLTAVLQIDPAERTASDTLAPFTAAMQPRDGKSTAYLCTDRHCDAPLTDPALLADKLLVSPAVSPFK